jgi:TPR repeat protein
MLREGTDGLEADPEVALVYLSEAARRGHYGAMTETARALAGSGQFVKAARMYRRAWEKQPSAQIGRELADILFDEIGDAAAMKAAFWLYWQADNRQACAHCRYRLGVMKLHGMGTIENNAEAIEWFSAAAALNHARAQFTLGVVYSTGLVVTRDYVTALKWLNIARHNGHAEASDLIGEVKTQVKRADVERSQRMASQWLAMDR